MSAIALMALGPVVGCGGPETSSPVRSTPTVIIEPSPPSTVGTTPRLATTASPSPTSEATVSSDPTSGAPPAATPTGIPVEALTTYDQYGFSLRLNRQTIISSAGWTEPEPSQSQGVLSFGYGGVNALLRWIPAEGVTSEAMLIDSYNILRNAQPEISFTPVKEGRITVSSEPGMFGSFAAADAAGAVLGGGVIGSWVCPASTTAFALTVTGPEATTLQIRFQRLLDSFSCPS